MTSLTLLDLHWLPLVNLWLTWSSQPSQVSSPMIPHCLVSADLLQVVEGETPLLLPEVSSTAEELREHGEEEREERWKWEEHEEEKWAEVQRLCRRCHIVTSQLRRQAAALTGRSSLQVRSQTTGKHHSIGLDCSIL